jgi:nucleotide-binding universal stress UspA family protein
MFKHLLLPTDGSNGALLAAPHALALAQKFDAQITAVFVIDPYPYLEAGGMVTFSLEDYFVAARQEADLALSEVKAFFDKAGLTINTLVQENHVPYEGILEAAKSAQADAIVMASHGRSGFVKLLLGSVTQKVLVASELPVLVIKHQGD